MGFLGGGGGGNNDATNAINQQIDENNAELEAKKQNLYQTRLDIIKGQGSQTFGGGYSGGAKGTTPSTALGKKS